MTLADDRLVLEECCSSSVPKPVPLDVDRD